MIVYKEAKTLIHIDDENIKHILWNWMVDPDLAKHVFDNQYNDIQQKLL